jgi:thiol:disulfide interchange protein DsbD
MGVPLLLIGFGAGKLLPKAGEWMDNIKNVFGVLLLGVALYLFSTLGIISPLILWGVFFIILSVFMKATSSIESKNPIAILSKGVGTVILVWGILLLIGAANGGYDIYKPLNKNTLTYVKNHPETKEKTFIDIGTTQELESKLAFAKNQHKTVILYFYTDTCPVCKHLNETTWKDTAIKSILNDKYIALSVNITRPINSATKAIQKRFKIFGPPGFVFFDKAGEELKDASFYGYQGPEEMYDTLDLIAE